MFLRQCEVVCDVDKMTVDVQSVLKKYKTIKQWAYIVHDKDDTRPHYHIYLNFGSGTVDTKMVAKWFKLKDNFVEKVKGRKTDMLQYLTHGNKSAQHKYQYPASEVKANFDFETEIKNSKIIGDFEKYSFAEQLKYVESLDVSQKSRVYQELKKLWELHCQCLTLQPNRNLQVVFITGKGGTGKTTYAKRMLDELGYDFSVSSSANDPFQDYKGQRAMILDDLRDKTFELDDLLKVLDNNTKSSVKSRFNNKVFNGKMIVITSSVPLNYWYSKYKNPNSKESLFQLYRRISDYIKVTPENIEIYDHVGEGGYPEGLKAVYPNEYIKGIQEVKNEKEELADIFAIISKREEHEN